MTKASILIVEDERVVGLDLRNSLQNCGYQVAGQTDRGEDALRQAAALHPDLVLMDIGLKGDVDGIEAAAQLRARLNLPVIFLTAFADEATLRRARPAEPYGYLLKPFDERELAGNIEMALYRHRAEKKLRESEARFRGVIAHASEGIVLADSQGNLIEWNPAAEQLTGLERSRVIGQPLLETITNLIPAESRTPGLLAALANRWNPEMKSERASGPEKLAECEIETPQGERRVIQISGFLVETDEGASAGASLRDITERKRAEAALRESEARFRGLFEYSPKEYAPATYTSGQPLLALVNDVLDLAQIAAGQLKLEAGRVSVADLCQAALDVTTPQARQKHISVSLALDPGVAFLQADARRLKQILVILLGNAITFTPAGGQVKLAVGGDEKERRVNFTVRDTGLGIAAEDLPRLFQDFVQLDARLARSYEGAGLGLALVRRLVGLHGGQVRAESDGLGQGSQFTVSLPWADENGKGQP